CGIPVKAVVDGTWLLSGVLCGLAGVVLVMDVQVLNSNTGSDFFILIIAAAVLGGIGSASGAIVGSIIIGVVAEVAAGFINPQFKDISAFVILAAVLLLRPTGVISSIASAKEVARGGARGRSSSPPWASTPSSTSLPPAGWTLRSVSPAGRN